MKVEKSIGSHKKNLIDPDSNMYLTVNSLIEVNENVNSIMDLIKCIWIKI